MNIAVIEDDAADQLKVRNLLYTYKEENGEDFQIDFYSKANDFINTNKNYHLVFVDIYLDNNFDGIDIVEKLYKYNKDVIIVFLTSSPVNIFRAVKTHQCFDYILKSDFNQKRLDSLFKDIKNCLRYKDRTITFSVGKKFITLRLSHIQYILSHNKYSKVIFKDNQERNYRVTFSGLCQLINSADNFLLCNRGILLNMDYIQKINNDSFQMLNNSFFPIRRRNTKEVIELFNEYQLKKLDNQKIIK